MAGNLPIMATLFGPALEVASTSADRAAKVVNGQNIPRLFPQKIDRTAMKVQPAYIFEMELFSRRKLWKGISFEERMS
jgi:hypothetical protein